MDLVTKPHSLTHVANISFDDDNQLIIHEVVGVDPNGVIRKVPTLTDGSLQVSQNSLPTAGNNPSLTLAYTSNVLQTVTKIINGVSYRKTLTYTGTDLTGVSAWVQI